MRGQSTHRGQRMHGGNMQTPHDPNQEASVLEITLLTIAPLKNCSACLAHSMCDPSAPTVAKLRCCSSWQFLIRGRTDRNPSLQEQSLHCNSDNFALKIVKYPFKSYFSFTAKCVNTFYVSYSITLQR